MDPSIFNYLQLHASFWSLYGFCCVFAVGCACMHAEITQEAV